jgi:hypothetical protein
MVMAAVVGDVVAAHGHSISIEIIRLIIRSGFWAAQITLRKSFALPPRLRSIRIRSTFPTTSGDNKTHEGTFTIQTTRFCQD